MAETAQELYDELSQPFPIEYISWRIGATRDPYESEIKEGKAKQGERLGKPLCYVDARAVMDRLDSVCGPENWQNNFTPGISSSIVCNLGIRVNEEWIWKSDGAGATDVEGEKGMLSDALKRAAVHWGIARYLYDLDAPFVVLERGKFLSKRAVLDLNNTHEEFAQKCGWGLRSGIQAYKLLNQGIKHWVTDQANVADFREKNAGMIAQLPVAMRRHLNDTLDRIGASAREAAE